jgi:hypothetical protein
VTGIGRVAKNTMQEDGHCVSWFVDKAALPAGFGCEKHARGRPTSHSVWLIVIDQVVIHIDNLLRFRGP